jgi:hypothetical protein
VNAEYHSLFVDQEPRSGGHVTAEDPDRAHVSTVAFGDDDAVDVRTVAVGLAECDRGVLKIANHRMPSQYNGAGLRIGSSAAPVGAHREVGAFADGYACAPGKMR